MYLLYFLIHSGQVNFFCTCLFVTFYCSEIFAVATQSRISSVSLQSLHDLNSQFVILTIQIYCSHKMWLCLCTRILAHIEHWLTQLLLSASSGIAEVPTLEYFKFSHTGDTTMLCTWGGKKQIFLSAYRNSQHICHRILGSEIESWKYFKPPYWITSEGSREKKTWEEGKESMKMEKCG